MAMSRFEADLAETALLILLSQNPSARLVALGDEGLPTTWPDTFDVGDHEILDGIGGMGLVVPEERVIVIDAWATTLDRGTSRVEVHLANDPDIGVILYHFDLRLIHGVIVSVLVPLRAGSEAELFEATASTAIPPRLARLDKDGQSRILSVDEGATQMLGWTADEMVGRRSLDFIHPDDHELAINNWMEMLSRPGMAYGARLRHLHADGSWVWVQIINHNQLGDREPRVVAQVVDISEEMAAVEALRARERLLDRLAEALPVGLFQIDLDRHVTYSNDRLTQILGDDVDVVTTLMDAVVDDDRPVLDAALDAAMGHGRDLDIEVRFRRRGQQEVRVGAVMLRALTDEGGMVVGAVASLADVTDSASMRLELERRATYDELTGCHNRASILAELNSALRAQSSRSGTAVVFVDLDEFKPVNDELGHAAGDELLSVVAHRLQGQTRDGDRVGRIGGDEFLIVCRRVSGRGEALQIAERVAASVSGEISLDGRVVEPQVSVGVAWTDIAIAADALIARADAAMYESKRLGRGEPVCAPVTSAAS
jgi:diguanylate cyclase (GGDEF)-like protein/PAS domain S-box-containing protein